MSEQVCSSILLCNGLTSPFNYTTQRALLEFLNFGDLHISIPTYSWMFITSVTEESIPAVRHILLSAVSPYQS